jgi:hypothetical protein
MADTKLSDLTTIVTVGSTDLLYIVDETTGTYASRKVTVPVFNAALDHGTVAGLLDDDHTQYARLAGRSGGQSLSGGTASGDDLTVASSSHSTKGWITLDTLLRTDVTNNLVSVIDASSSDPNVTIGRTATSGGHGYVDVYNSSDVDVIKLVVSTGEVRGTTLTSTVSTGTAPLTVTSTTKVTNLNADLLDGLEATAIASMPRGHISGLILSNAVGDPTNDITVAVGECRDIDDTEDMVLSSAITKRADAAWTVGTNQGGMDTGTFTTNVSYHLWLIKNTSSGVVDVLFSASATAPTMPAGYTKKRRLGSFHSSFPVAIPLFHQYGDLFVFDEPGTVDTLGDITAGQTLTLLPVPSGVVLTVDLTVAITSPTAACRLLYTSLAAANINPTTDYANALSTAAGALGVGFAKVVTNTSRQIRQRSSGATDTSASTHIVSWTDTRGKDG